MTIRIPRLRFWQIINMNVGFFGIQYSFGLQQTAVNPLYTFLHARPEELPLLNLAGPMTGLLIQPLIGAMSDRTWHPRWGRRKPFFLTGAIFCSLCLFAFPFSRSLWMAVGLLWILDAANNTAMEPYRAFIADKLPGEQRAMGFLTQSFFTGLGITLANLSLGFFRSRIPGETHTSDGQSGIPYWVFGSFFVGAVCSIVTVLWSVLTTPEIAPTPEELIVLREKKKGFFEPFREIGEAIGDMPRVMWQLALVYLFQWYAMFCYWQFVSLSVAKSVFGLTADKGLAGNNKELYEQAVVMAGKLNGFYNIVTFLSAFGLAWLAGKISAKYTHIGCLALAAVSLLSFAHIDLPILLYVPMIGFGIAWASMMGVPYIMVVGSIPKERYGVYMGIINMMIVVPMIIQTLSFGWVYHHWLGDDPSKAISFAGFLLLAACLATFLIPQGSIKNIKAFTVYHFALHESINAILQERAIDIAGRDNGFYVRMMANASAIRDLYDELYGQDARAEASFGRLIRTIVDAYLQRPAVMRQKDVEKMRQESWFCSNELAGMSLYVDRWCGGLEKLPATFGYLHGLGINLLHLMPVFQSPPGESDGGYAVSDFRAVDPKYGSLQDLQRAQTLMGEQGMYLMLDIVLNHTSRQHEWAEKARAGDVRYQDYFYMFPDRSIPDAYERGMPEVFPESSPGNFTYVTECQKWAMTVFHHYQWDLNYRNPEVLVAMLDNVFFYANLGVDILRIDAPAFIWKIVGTACQNLPEAHTLLRLIKQCVQAATPGMAILGEAIVAPSAIIKYFGTGVYTGRECDVAYNATQMALQWDALATGDTRVMLAAQQELLQKPVDTTWISYTRCHDDIGFGYEDWMIAEAGYHPTAHRKFLMEYYSGRYAGSDAMGALFSVHPITQDARISGSLASLCGVERALLQKDEVKSRRAIDKILLMQAHSLFIGGIPMLFYGDEAGYTNDYSYLQDPGKSYDNRWMHRPVIDWERNERTAVAGTVEGAIFSGTKRLICIRKKLAVVGDRKNLVWLAPYSVSVAGYVRTGRAAGSGSGAQAGTRALYCLFNFGPETAYVSWYVFKELSPVPGRLYDHWAEKYYQVGADHEYLEIAPYAFLLMETAG